MYIVRLFFTMEFRAVIAPCPVDRLVIVHEPARKIKGLSTGIL